MCGDNDVTLIIKTFIRISCVERLLKTIERYAKECPIIICDDGPEANENKKLILSNYKDLDIKYIVTEEDIGLSKGRNILIDNVKTKFFVLCDDDFVFYSKTNIELAKKSIELNNLDILGGLCLHANRVNYGGKFEKIELFIREIQKIFHHYRKVGYRGEIIRNNDEIEIKNDKINYCSNTIIPTDICENFFIAKTDIVRKIRWYDELKLNEHEDFFIRAKDMGIRIAINPKFKVYHYPEHSVTFKKFRNKNYYADVLKNNKIKKLKIYRNNVGIIQTYLLEGNEIKVMQEYPNNLLGKIKEIYYKRR